jgi:hypothetical protein
MLHFEARFMAIKRQSRHKTLSYTVIRPEIPSTLIKRHEATQHTNAAIPDRYRLR